MDLQLLRHFDPASTPDCITLFKAAAAGWTKAAFRRKPGRMSDPTAFYVGWLVDPEDRAALLDRFPPRYPLVVAHHVTQKFGEIGRAHV